MHELTLSGFVQSFKNNKKKLQERIHSSINAYIQLLSIFSATWYIVLWGQYKHKFKWVKTYSLSWQVLHRSKWDAYKTPVSTHIFTFFFFSVNSYLTKSTQVLWVKHLGVWTKLLKLSKIKTAALCAKFGPLGSLPQSADSYLRAHIACVVDNLSEIL